LSSKIIKKNCQNLIVKNYLKKKIKKKKLKINFGRITKHLFEDEWG